MFLLPKFSSPPDIGEFHAGFLDIDRSLESLRGVCVKMMPPYYGADFQAAIKSAHNARNLDMISVTRRLTHFLADHEWALSYTIELRNSGGDYRFAYATGECNSSAVDGGAK